MRLTSAIAAVFAAAGPAAADCPTIASDLVTAWSAREPAAMPRIEDAREAVCIRDAFLTSLGGSRVGWRVAFASEAARDAVGLEFPMLAQILDGMLVEDATRVPQGYAARPAITPGLIATVGDEGVMLARTHSEVLEALTAIAPVVSLGDLLYEEGAPLDYFSLYAINAGTRVAVVGESVEPGADWAEGLASMTVRFEDETGTVLGEYPGSAALGHPLDAVLWLIGELTARGETLQAGDVVSVAGFGSPVAVPEVGGLRVTFLGLPDGEPTALALFE